MNMYIIYAINMLIYSLLCYVLLHLLATRWVLAIMFGMTMAILNLKDRNMTEGRR